MCVRKVISCVLNYKKSINKTFNFSPYTSYRTPRPAIFFHWETRLIEELGETGQELLELILSRTLLFFSPTSEGEELRGDKDLCNIDCWGKVMAGLFMVGKLVWGGRGGNGSLFIRQYDRKNTDFSISHYCFDLHTHDNVT